MVDDCGYESFEEMFDDPESYWREDGKEGNICFSKITLNLGILSLMELPNLFDSREDMLMRCQDVVEQLPNYTFEILFEVRWETMGYLQYGNCMFNRGQIEYVDLGRVDSEYPTCLSYKATFKNGVFCNEEKLLYNEDGLTDEEQKQLEEEDRKLKEAEEEREAKRLEAERKKAERERKTEYL